MALLNTDFLTARTQSFRATRHMLTSALQEGVVGAGEYKVTPTGTSLQWSVAAGAAWVQGDDTTRQGVYHQVNDGAVTGLVAAGHATNPRLDQVILRIFDSSVTGGSDTPTLSTLAGTASGGATLDNRTGAAALPNGALLLADILVPALHSGVLTTGMIRDRRKWARGAYRKINRTGGDYSLTATTITIIDATNLSPRIECSGLPVRVSMYAQSEHSAAVLSRFVPRVDGVIPAELGTDGQWTWDPGGQRFSTLSPTWSFTPAAGSHLISLAYRTTSGTLTMRANAANAFQMVVEEVFRQDASND